MMKENNGWISVEDKLPRPIKEFGNLKKVYYINLVGDKYEPYLCIKKDEWSFWQQERLKNGCYYASFKDCQAICDWLMNR